MEVARPPLPTHNSETGSDSPYLYGPDNTSADIFAFVLVQLHLEHHSQNEKMSTMQTDSYFHSKSHQGNKQTNTHVLTEKLINLWSRPPVIKGSKS